MNSIPMEFQIGREAPHFEMSEYKHLGKVIIHSYEGRDAEGFENYPKDEQLLKAVYEFLTPEQRAEFGPINTLIIQQHAPNDWFVSSMLVDFHYNIGY